MKRELNSVKDVKINELKEYVLTFLNNDQEEIMMCWSMKSLLKLVSFQQDLYDKMLNALYHSNSYEEMEYHLRMMNVLYTHVEYQVVKKDLLLKLLERYVGISQYLVIRHLIDFKEISFEVFMNQLYKQKTSLIEIVKICLIEDEYQLAYLYLKQMDYCDDEVILDLLSQHSPTLYYRLKLHYYSKQKQSFLLQTQ